MKNNRTIQKQRGFFDLGIGIALTILFGGTAAVINVAHAEKDNLAKPEAEIVQNVDTKSEVVGLVAE